MALADRQLLIDDQNGSPLDVSDLLVGGMGDLGKMAFPAQDLTGAAHTRPKRKHTGFGSAEGFTLQFEKTSTTLAAFYGAGAVANNPRMVSVDRGDGDEFEVAANIVNTRIITEAAENAVDVIEVQFETTGEEAYSI